METCKGQESVKKAAPYGLNKSTYKGTRFICAGICSVFVCLLVRLFLLLLFFQSFSFLMLLDREPKTENFHYRLLALDCLIHRKPKILHRSFVNT